MQQVGRIKSHKTIAGMSSWEAGAFLFLLGGFFFIGMNLYEPVWARWKIMDILESTMEEAETLREKDGTISSRILKRMSVNNVYGVTLKDFKIQKSEKTIRLTFDKTLISSMPFNIELHVKVKKLIEVARPLN